jgi:hypothetical protein
MSSLKKLWALALTLLGMLAWEGRASAATHCLNVPLESPHAGSGIRALYFTALCGSAMPEVLDVVNSGESRVFRLPERLATALDIVTPAMHRVDYVWVRGGGQHKPTLVVPFTNGVSGLFFKSNAVWTEQQAINLGEAWGKAPYEFMRRATSKFHDAVLMENGVGFGINLFGAFIQFSDGANTAGLAYPFGFVMFSSPSLSGSGAAALGIHEMAHYNHYYDEGLTPFAYVGNFGSISRHNCSIFWGWIKIPFCYHQNAGVGREAYVSWYGANGGGWPILEDYAETLSFAVAATQVFRTDVPFRYRYQHETLFGASDPFLKKKAEFMTSVYTYSGQGPMDADGDGQKFNPFDTTNDTGDCNDINPASSKHCSETIDSCANREDGWYCSVMSPYSAIRCLNKQILDGYSCSLDQKCVRSDIQTRPTCQ